jgi:hypothetical protein
MAVSLCSETADYTRTLHCHQAHIVSFHDSHITELQLVVHSGQKVTLLVNYNYISLEL